MQRTLFPHEVVLENLTQGNKYEYPNKDWSQPIYYNNTRLYVQINDAKTLFGVMSYNNPQASQDAQTRFSTGMCLDQNNQQIKDFITLNTKIESMVKAMQTNTQSEFITTMKTNPKGEKHLRLKLPVRSGVPQFDVLIDKQRVNVDRPTLESKLHHGRVVNLIIGLNAVWHSGNKYGISWRVVAIEFSTTQFRTDTNVAMLDFPAN